MKSNNSKNDQAIPTVLVVENDAISEKVVVLNLQDLQVSFDVARDAKSALQLVAKNHYVLILMDAGLPDMSGYELTEAIRKITDESLSIVCLSAHGDEEHMRRCKEVGMDGVYVKPVTQPMLQEILRDFI